MSKHQQAHRTTPTLPKRQAAWVVLAALVMGGPTIRGGFVGADDHRLVLNHVLVSQPSLTHAVELFTIPHRDLYQPLPLVSFSLEFAVARWFGWDAEGAGGVAWLFHLDNMLLHALNALLVWLVIVWWQALIRSRAGAKKDDLAVQARDDGDRGGVFLTATVAALIFAVHPIQTEVVAWVNGRMMLLSTMFALLAVLSVTAWVSSEASHGEEERNGGVSLALLAVGLAVLCGLSKVRVGLPVLVLVPLMISRRLRDRRAMLMWFGVAVVTGAFAIINIRITAEANMFAGGEEMLHGPRLARVLLALSSYFQHLIWPVNLASFYPAPPDVRWGGGSTIAAIGVVAAVLGFGGWRMKHSAAARWGGVWFFATLASTLPFVPARNLLSADRYLYLPIVGLCWAVAAGLVDAIRRVGWSSGGFRVVRLGGAAVVAVWIAGSWHVGSFYATAAAKTQRIAEVSPNTPRLWTQAGWARYELGDYDRAIDYAKRDLAFDDVVAQSRATELIGACALKQGKPDEGLSELQRAFEIDPRNAKAVYRLAVAYEDEGQMDQALVSFEAAVEAAPRYNPALIRLANLYGRSGRADAARKLYERAFESNAYDAAATRGLMELDVREGVATFDALVTRGSTAEAADVWPRLVRQWPESAEIQVWALWANALAERSGQTLSGAVPVSLGSLADATQALIALQEHNYHAAAAYVERLSRAESDNSHAQRRLLDALQRHDAAHPGDAWTMCLAARLLIADGQREAALAFTGLCERQCTTGGCAAWVRRLHESLGLVGSD